MAVQFVHEVMNSPPVRSPARPTAPGRGSRAPSSCRSRCCRRRC